MYHLRLKGEHYQMGVKRGLIFQKAKMAFPLHLDKFQIEHGKASEKILKEFFPEVCEEILGISDTMGIDYLPFASWMLCMGCCMYNLEENIPVEIRGCTAFASDIPEGKGIKKDFSAALKEMACSISTGRKAEDRFVSPGIPRIMYKLAGQMGWRKQIKENGLSVKELSRRILK